MARLRKTLTDYVVIAISPALIMVLVGSLVFFLIEVFYGGGLEGRTKYVFSLFIFAAVLIARISIEEGRERAILFAIPLAVAMLIVCGLTLFNVVVIGLIWWCADKLTWDCTVIDEREDASGEGLLQTVGLEGHSEKGSSGAAQTVEDLEATSSREAAPEPANWWERFVERRKRPHAPGVWVIYFSLAALPLFGIGQRFIPESDLPARQHAFKLLCYYVASGLGLLMTTSFLGLRRYLRQRRLEMPLDMTGVWLTVGTVMILALLLVCALLPRPSAEYSITDWSFQFDAMEQRQASRYGWGNEGAEDEKQLAQTAAPSGRETSKPAGGPTGRQEAGGGTQDRGSQGRRGESGQGQPGSAASGKQSKSGGSPSGKQGKPGRRSAGGRDRSARDSQAADGGGQTGKSETKKQQPERTERDGSGRHAGQRSSAGAPGRTSQASQPGRTGTDRSGHAGSPQPPPSFNPSSMASSFLGGLSQIFKFLYYLFFIVLVGYLLWRYRQEVLAAVRGFWEAIRDFWANLFGGRRVETDDEAPHVGPAPPPRPFADFTDPFATGTAARYTPQELVAYTFEATEAWAREHGCGRHPEQTPHEFAHRVAASLTSHGTEARTLADLYCAAAYSEDTLSRTSVQRLERLWQALRANAAQQPVGA